MTYVIAQRQIKPMSWRNWAFLVIALAIVLLSVDMCSEQELTPLGSYFNRSGQMVWWIN